MKWREWAYEQLGLVYPPAAKEKTLKYMRIPLQLNGKVIGEVESGALDSVKIEKVVTVGSKLVNLCTDAPIRAPRYTVKEFFWEAKQPKKRKKKVA